MKADYIDCFYKGTNRIFSDLLGTSTQMQPALIDKDWDYPLDLGLSLYIDGEINGGIYFIFSGEVLENILSTILGYRASLNDFHKAILRELIHMIGQEASSYLDKEKVTHVIKPGQVFDSQLEDLLPAWDQAIYIPVISGLGKFYMNIYMI